MQQMIYWQSIIPRVLGVFIPIFRRADCVSLPMVSCQATSSAQCTHLATRLSGTMTATTRTGNHRQWHAVCSPDDGRKDARNMLRNYWLPVNHYLLHLVGLAFICIYFAFFKHCFTNIKLTNSHPHMRLWRGTCCWLPLSPQWPRFGPCGLLWWTNWQRDGGFFKVFCFLLSLTFHHWSILVFIPSTTDTALYYVWQCY